MPQGRAKKHHFVPRALQKWFCEQGETIWFCERDCRGQFSAPERRNTSSTFKKRDYNTVLEGNRPSDVVEKQYFGPADDFVGILLTEIAKGMACGQIPPISQETKGDIRKLVTILVRRSPDFMIGYDDDLALGREVVERTLAVVDADSGPACEEQALKRKLGDDLSLRQIGRDVRVRAQISPLEKSEKVLQEFDIRWAQTSGKHTFILSSRMVYRVGNGGSGGLNDARAQLWVPLMPTLALVMLRDPANRYPYTNYIGRDLVRSMNEYAARNSVQIASSSERQLKSLTR